MWDFKPVLFSLGVLKKLNNMQICWFDWFDALITLHQLYNYPNSFKSDIKWSAVLFARAHYTLWMFSMKFFMWTHNFQRVISCWRVKLNELKRPTGSFKTAADDHFSVVVHSLVSGLIWWWCRSVWPTIAPLLIRQLLSSSLTSGLCLRKSQRYDCRWFQYEWEEIHFKPWYLFSSPLCESSSLTSRSDFHF